MALEEGIRVGIYARQSVDEEQGISQQIDDCRAEAIRRGWVVVDAYTDNDTSATKQRDVGTAWASMLAAFDRGEINTVLTTRVDRLTRKLVDVLELTPPRREVRVVTVQGGIDTATDDFTFKMLVLMAEHEIQEKSSRTKRYAQERHQKGHPKPGSTPHGYRWVIAQNRGEYDSRFVVDEDEASDVQFIFDEFLSGTTLYQIAAALNREGRRARSGGKWYASSMRRLLMNPHYAALLPPLSGGKGERRLEDIDLEDCIKGAWKR